MDNLITPCDRNEHRYVLASYETVTESPATVWSNGEEPDSARLDGEWESWTISATYCCRQPIIIHYKMVEWRRKCQLCGRVIPVRHDDHKHNRPGNVFSAHCGVCGKVYPVTHNTYSD